MAIVGERGLSERPLGEAVEIAIKYEGYLTRQREQITRFHKLEGKTIPHKFPYARVPGFSHEVVEKLSRVQPATVGQASRIAGMTPAALSLLLVALERFHRQPQPREHSPAPH